MTLAELGELLLEERVHRGYTVDEVADRLKITSRMVRAIEEGDVSSLPHAVYVRGFVRAYAAFLEVDDEAVRSALQNLSDFQESASAQEAPCVADVRRPRRKFRSLLFFFLCCCAGLVVYFYFQSRIENDAAQALPETPARAVPVVASPPPAPEQREPDPVPAAVETPAAPPAAPVVPVVVSAQETPASPDSSAPSPAPRAENEPVRTNGFSLPETEASAPEPARTLTLQDGVSQTDITDAGKGKHQIILSAQQECWVHSSADGTDTRQFSLKKGEVFALSFDRRLTLKLGNAGGVRIKYDGREMPAAGGLGQVRTLTFPPQQ